MAKRWSMADVQQLANKGVKVIGVTPVLPKVKRLKQEPKGLKDIKQVLTILGIPFETEHRFHEYRKFRFDVALIEHKIAVEYEGIFSDKSRHTSVKGYNRDMEKYNLAQALGWRVLRYSAATYKDFIIDLKQMIEL
jgi:very-short-patch-repair endonuclease